VGNPSNGGAGRTATWLCRGTAYRRLIRVAAVVMMLAAGSILSADAAAQDSLGFFRIDPVRHFTEAPGQVWVGSGRFFMTDYSDTLVITPDSTGTGLMVDRVLVDEDDTVVVSRGRGTIVPQGNASYAVRWSERRYPDVEGRMRWQDGQWVVTFEGEWSAWSVRVRYDTPESLVAAVARSLGSFPPVELAALKYRVIPATE